MECRLLVIELVHCGSNSILKVLFLGDPVHVTCRPLHNVQFVKYNDTVSFMAQVLDTVTYLVPQVLDTAS